MNELLKPAFRYSAHAYTGEPYCHFELRNPLQQRVHICGTLE